MDYVEIVKSVYAAFGAGDIPKVIAQTARDVVWTSYAEQGFPSCGTFHGHAGVAEFFTLDQSTFNTTSFVPEEFYSQGATVIATGQEGGTMAVGNIPMTGHWTHVFDFDERGLIARFRQYLSTEQQSPSGARILWAPAREEKGG